MYKVYELKDLALKQSVCEKFLFVSTDLDRVFVVEELGKTLGILSMTFDKGIKINFIKLQETIGLEVFDLLVRSSMNALRYMKGIKVYIESDNNYFESLGFTLNNGIYETLTENLKFDGNCLGHTKRS